MYKSATTKVHTVTDKAETVTQNKRDWSDHHGGSGATRPHQPTALAGGA